MAEATESPVVDPRVLARSVQEPPRNGVGPGGASSQYVFMTAHAADEITPWGMSPKARDMQLRDFITIEPLFNSALGTVCSRNASFSWKLDGPEEQTTRLQRVLQNSQFGEGWASLMLKVSMDLYTQDHGAFIEIIREKDSEFSNVIALAHLDAGRCYPTGDPEEPVWYVDRFGQYHKMKWYQIGHILEAPAAVETLPGVQYCALTRMLMHAQIMRDTEIYYKEKIGGRNPRAITAVRGIKAQEVLAAITVANNLNDAMGRLRYTNPVIVSSADPNAEVGFDTLEVAALPDGFDADLNQKQYLTLMALAFMTDYQEFAPLPGGGLGTSSQSEILDKKSRGKGPGLFMKLISQFLNFRVLPEEVQFEWDEQDIQEDKVVAEVKKLRAETIQIMLSSQSITAEVAWMMMLDNGDLTQEQYDLLLKQQEEQRLAEEAAAEEAAAMAEEMNAGAAAPLQENASPGAQTFPGAQPQPEELKAWSESNQIRDPKGRFAGTRGGSGGGGAAGGAGSDEDVIPSADMLKTDEKGDPVPSEAARRLAAQNVARAKEAEAKITAELQALAAEEGGEMFGLEFRVKSEGSMARKIESDAVLDHKSYKEAAAAISDSVRYTMLFDEGSYAEKATETLAKLQERGFETTKVKNYWTIGNGDYRGLNTNAVHKETGLTIELQFHTPTSIQVKEVINHPLYERQRLLTTPAEEKARLSATQRANWQTVSTPPGVDRIPTKRAPWEQ